jgi:hypothetical protein
MNTTLHLTGKVLEYGPYRIVLEALAPNRRGKVQIVIDGRGLRFDDIKDWEMDLDVTVELSWSD